MPIWLTLCLALGGSALISCVVGFVFNLVVNGTKAKIKEKEQERTDEIRGIVKDELSTQNKVLEQINQKLDKCVEGTVTGIRMNLKLSLDFLEWKGYATNSEKAAWNEAYQEYDKLGGNHFLLYVNGWKERVNNLPENSSGKE